MSNTDSQGMYVAWCTEDNCDGGDDLPVEGLGPMGPYLMAVYHEDSTGHDVEYARGDNSQKDGEE